MITSRIPSYTDKSFDGMLIWFAEISKRDLLFHPDDAPETIVSLSDGEKFFSVHECRLINNILDDMFSEFGDDVYEAAYPVYMKRMGIQLDA